MTRNLVNDERGEFDIATMSLVTIIIYAGLFLVFGAEVYEETMDRVDAFTDNGASLLDIVTDWVPDVGLLLLHVVIDSLELGAFVFTLDIWPILKISLALILVLGWVVAGIGAIKQTFS